MSDLRYPHSSHYSKSGPAKKSPLWLCLYFFELPLAHLLLQDSDACIAIAEKKRITFVSDRASEQGIELKMSVATAYALLPKIRIEERNIDIEVKTLDTLAGWCYQFTPQVSLYKNFSVALEISSSLLLFQGLNNLFPSLKKGLLSQGYRFQWGLAHSLHGAWLLSQAEEYNIEIKKLTPQLLSAEHFLPGIKKIPLSYLDVDQKKQQQLKSLGLHSIGDLLSLPTSSLGKRFGKAIIDLVQSIEGDKIAIQDNIRPAHQYEEKLDVSIPVTQISHIIHSMEGMLKRLCYFLHVYHYHTILITWRFYHVNCPSEVIDISVSPTNNTLDSFLSLTRLKLDKHQFSAPIESIELHSERFMKAVYKSRELFVDLPHPSNQLADYHFLLDKLINRLGRKNLVSLSLGDDNLPDYRQVCNDIDAQSLSAIDLPVSINEPPSFGNSLDNCCWEPLWLREKPLLIKTLDYKGPLCLVSGPRRYDSHWWSKRQKRDYFIVRHNNGAYFWVFKDLSAGQWYLHGVFG